MSENQEQGQETKTVAMAILPTETKDKIEKAEHFLQVESSDVDYTNWYQPKYNRFSMMRLIDNSSILPQCCSAYGDNIAGFGISIEYKDEYHDIDETPEMEKEWNDLDEILNTIYLDGPLTDLFVELINNEEQIGCAYIEIMREPNGAIRQIDLIKEPWTIEKSKPQGNYVDVNYEYNGKSKIKKKRFCKYRQQINGETVYFKECGDTRVMNYKTGEYYKDVSFEGKQKKPFVEEHGAKKEIPIENQANEILEIKIGNDPYGKPRWIGNCLSIDGSWRAESLNNNYFRHGRHTPLLIMIEGGSLDAESEAQIKNYVNAVEGENGQHGFLVISSKAPPNAMAAVTGEDKPKITIKELGAVLQKDELFQGYIDSNRKRVQSSFKLPDLYVGYTTDFNRATAQAAIEVTEKQVFQKRRKSLAWFVNHKLLDFISFKYVQVRFNAPEVTTVEDLVALLNVAVQGDAISPNALKNVIYEQLGLSSEDFEEDLTKVSWADVPSRIFERWINAVTSNTVDNFQKSIDKAVADGANDDVIATLRAIKKELKGAVDNEATNDD